jgi:tRNA(Ile)-lysidine synthase
VVIADVPDLRLTAAVSDLIEQFSNVVTSQKLLPDGRVVVVAVSGGLDSMALLHLMEALKARFKWTIHVAHFNHRLRGRASLADEKFVRKQAEKLGLEFHCSRWDDAAQRKLIKKHGIEMAAREARLGFLGETARAVKSKNVVLAHHADDQAELFFIRMFRGAGSFGLGGMRMKTGLKTPVSCSLIRPLLGCSRSALEDWAKSKRIRFREDASNQDFRYLRNRIRHELIPRLELDYAPGVSAKLSRTMEILSAEAEWWRAEAGRALEDSTLQFSELPVPLQRHVIVIQLERLDVEFDFELVERLRDPGGLTVNVCGDRFVSRNAAGRIVEHANQSLVFEADSRRVDLRKKRASAAFGGRKFTWMIRSKPVGSAFAGVSDGEVFDLANVGGSITLRFWRPGDRFQPIGSARAAKLQDLFTNARISAKDRRRRVVVETESGHIFWVEGLRIGERAKVTAKTRDCLVWRWSIIAGNG